MEKWLESLYTDGSKYFVSNPLPKKGEKIKIYIRVYEDSPVRSIYIKTKLNGVEMIFKMNKEYVKSGLTYYGREFAVYEDVFHYHFYVSTDDKIYYYNQLEITDYEPDETYDFRILTDYDQPSWVRESVFYQIFPERFCDGDPSLDVKNEEYYFDGHPAKHIDDWNAAPKEYNEAFCLDFYGGDLIGVKNKIPYLKKLGVNAIYMNPIFYAATVHKYDCLDYFTVDPHFGGDKGFIDLMDELHNNNMKLMLDTSINHTGTANKWFNKEGIFFDKSVGAYNNKDAAERKYYFFNDDNSYKAWFNVETLPTLNYTSDALREIIYRGENSLVKKYLKEPYCIDGWRFDVADTMARNDRIQLHHEIWPEIRKSIKEVNSEAYMIGEDWSDASEFLQGKEWDSSMNYFGSCRPIREFLGGHERMTEREDELRRIHTKLNARGFSARLKRYLGKLPFVIQENQFNLIDSHDISRLHNDSSISFSEYRGAIITLFTLIGAPNMYYGDEAGIDGRIDSMEGCRYTMPWNKDIESTDYYKLYSKLCHLKTSSEALKYGGMKILTDDNNVISFARFTDKQVFITVFSTDEEERKINIPYKIFAIDLTIGDKDEFENKLDYDIEDDNLILKVPAHTSYLIRL